MNTLTVVLILALAAATYLILSAIANHFSNLTDTLTMLFSDLTAKIADAKQAVDAVPARVAALVADAPSPDAIAATAADVDAITAAANAIAPTAPTTDTATA